MGMNRTFKGFLGAYCRELSELDTGSLRKLTEAAKDNARLVEPLFAFAAAQGKENYLVRLSKGAWFHDDYARLSNALGKAGSLEGFLASPDAPARYAAVLDAYKSQGDMIVADRRIIGLMRPRIMQALERAGLSRYQLCRDLGLNAGNVYAYLAGDDSKVSKGTAQKMLRYAEGSI